MLLEVEVEVGGAADMTFLYLKSTLAFILTVAQWYKFHLMLHKESEAQCTHIWKLQTFSGAGVVASKIVWRKLVKGEVVHRLHC